MKRRSLVVLGMGIARLLLMTSTASAEKISGTGTLSARGAGLAILRGTGELQVEGQGVGIVWMTSAETLEASAVLLTESPRAPASNAPQP